MRMPEGTLVTVVRIHWSMTESRGRNALLAVSVALLRGLLACSSSAPAEMSPGLGTPRMTAPVAAPYTAIGDPGASPAANHVTSSHEPPRDGQGLGAVPEEWTWIAFPDSHCANGTPTGVAVDVHPGARQLVVFLEGGGACDNADNCWERPTAVHIASGYGVEELGVDPALRLPIFDRGSADNPFADASYVFVPYCTGDLHAGNAVATYDVGGVSTPTYHHGARNLDLYLARLGSAFPSATHVWLVGQSAGGFGALFNQDFVARAFGVRTDVVDDSGPGIGWSGYPASWNVRLPPGCDDCTGGLAPLFLYDRRTYPESRFAFLSFARDAILPGFYGATQQDVDVWLGEFEQGLSAMPNAQSFVAPGTGHVVIGGAEDPGTQVAVATWLTQMATDDASWGPSGGTALGPPGDVSPPSR